MRLETYDVESAIEGADLWSEMAWASEDSWYKERLPDTLEILGDTYPLEILDTKVGEEGDWHTATYIIFKVGDQIFKKIGYYASHDGEYWDGSLTEVFPKEKTITVYEEA